MKKNTHIDTHTHTVVRCDHHMGGNWGKNTKFGNQTAETKSITKTHESMTQTPPSHIRSGPHTTPRDRPGHPISWLLPCLPCQHVRLLAFVVAVKLQASAFLPPRVSPRSPPPLHIYLSPSIAGASRPRRRLQTPPSSKSPAREPQP